MSRDYTNTTLLCFGTVDTPNTGDVVGYLYGSSAFYLTAGVVRVKTAGAQSASLLRVREKGETASLLDIAMGTEVADTIIAERPTDANALLAADTVYEVVHITTDASAVYDFSIYGTMPFE